MHRRADAQHGSAPADDKRHGAGAPGAASSLQEQGLHVFLLLLALRILNALTTRTFFQPDEYFQSLEPAWQMAFGEQGAAWITWEWKNQLRSSLHPALFAGLFAGVSAISGICSVPLALRAELLIAAPKITQAALAASTDYFTWRLAERAFGVWSSAAWASVCCGVLTLSVLADRLYYGLWTFPPLRFIHFNIAKSLAVFYGTNRADYYLTEGLPLLLTTALPFAAHSIWKVLWKDARSGPVPSYLALTCVTMTGALSLISHKEVRFIYPLLPMLHVLAAQPVASFLRPLTSRKKVAVAGFIATNLFIAGYASQVHQRGVIDVIHMLRHQHESQALQNSVAQSQESRKTTVGFLMPCHSTPWRSHLVYPEIKAWALTCEPPIDVPLDQRASYLDEADEFYLDPGPVAWLDQHMESVGTIRDRWNVSKAKAESKPSGAESWRPWPAYLVFFQQLEDTLSKFLQGTRYRECWRGFNSHFHDDWRRKGDVVVWCLDEDGPSGAHGRVEQTGSHGHKRLSSGQWAMERLRNM
ncbi:glycosylphosphatidylinositol anchor biosynthesis [Botryosphaeria dothidea]